MLTRILLALSHMGDGEPLLSLEMPIAFLQKLTLESIPGIAWPPS